MAFGLKRMGRPWVGVGLISRRRMFDSKNIVITSMNSCLLVNASLISMGPFGCFAEPLGSIWITGFDCLTSKTRIMRRMSKGSLRKGKGDVGFWRLSVDDARR